MGSFRKICQAMLSGIRHIAKMKLGAFSISLAVKDLAASRAFYAKLGFRQVGGDPKQHWLILRNAETTIGLFQGMFDRNTLTFNPGWTSESEELKEFADIREIQRQLKASGMTLLTEADEEVTRFSLILVRDR